MRRVVVRRLGSATGAAAHVGGDVGESGVEIGTLEQAAAEHHGANAPQVCDIGERVAVQQHQVGDAAGGHSPKVRSRPKNVGGSIVAARSACAGESPTSWTSSSNSSRRLAPGYRPAGLPTSVPARRGTPACTASLMSATSRA